MSKIILQGGVSLANYYEILGVSRDADKDQIEKAYRQLAKEYHPDKHKDNPLAHLAEDKMKQFNQAYEVLSDPNKRQKYDERIKNQQGQGSSGTGKQQASGSSNFSDGNAGSNSGAKGSQQSQGSQRGQKGNFVACNEHPDRPAVSGCGFCNIPLCQECYHRFNIVSCPDCLLEYNRGYLNELKKPLISTGIAAVIGFILGLSSNFGMAILGMLYAIGLYWGWHWVKEGIFYGALSGFAFGPIGIFTSLVMLLMFGWIPGVIRALTHIIPAAYKLYTEAPKVKEAEEYIMSIKNESTNTGQAAD